MPNSSRSSPKRARESPKRQAILRAAARAFLTKGYEGTSMELVAVESGAGRQTVYNQFANKKALFDDTVALLWDDMRIDQIVSQTQTTSSPEVTLARIGNAIADFWAPEESVDFVRMVIAESVHFPELAASFFSFGRDPARRAVVEYLRKLHEAKAFEVADADLAAAQFVGLLNESLLWSRVAGGEKPPSKALRKYIVDQAVQTFLLRYRK